MDETLSLVTDIIINYRTLLAELFFLVLDFGVLEKDSA